MLNLTPHQITVRSQDGTDHVFPPSGQLARVATTEVVVGSCHGRPGVFAPDSGPSAIRDDRGLVVAVTRLVAA